MGGMVTIFDPQGNKGEIPQERLADAVKAGAKPAVTMKAPDGTLGEIPADRLQDAVKAGASVVPFEQQENQHAGFWHTLWSDLSSIRPSGVSPYPGMDQDIKTQMAADAGQQDQARKAAGYSPAYRALAPVAQSVGANVPGMEQAATQGDMGGVAGHFAAAAAPIAAGEAISQGGRAIAAKIPNIERAGAAFQEVSKAVGKNEVAVTPSLSDALTKYQELVDAGGSRSMAVSKLLNRVTRPEAPPLTYDEARLFQSNISRLSADEAQRLTPVMKRQVGQIAAELNDAVENTAAQGGKLGRFQAAMEEYSKAKTLEKRVEILKKYGIKTISAAALGGAGAAGAKAIYDAMQ